MTWPPELAQRHAGLRPKLGPAGLRRGLGRRVAFGGLPPAVPPQSLRSPSAVPRTGFMPSGITLQASTRSPHPSNGTTGRSNWTVQLLRECGPEPALAPRPPPSSSASPKALADDLAARAGLSWWSRVPCTLMSRRLESRAPCTPYRFAWVHGKSDPRRRPLVFRSKLPGSAAWTSAPSCHRRRTSAPSCPWLGFQPPCPLLVLRPTDLRPRLGQTGHGRGLGRPPPTTRPDGPRSRTRPPQARTAAGLHRT